MSAGEPDGGRVEQVVEVYDASDDREATAPSPARTVAAAAVVVAVVAGVLSGLYVLAGGTLLVALAAAVATAPTGSADREAVDERSRDADGELSEAAGRLLDRLRAGLPGDDR